MTIDLSRLPPPSLVPVDPQADLDSRVVSLKARFDAADIEWTVGALKANPAVLLQEEDNYRQTLDKQAINDMALARTIGFARGADLDHLAATFYADVPNIARIEGESDARYERRILLAGEALAGALTQGGIEYHALANDGRIVDALAYQLRPGTNQCVILVEDDAPADAIVGSLYAHLRQPKLRGSEETVVRLANRIERSVSVVLRHGAGPDASLLKAEAERALAALKLRVETKIGAALTTDEIIAEARVGGIAKLVLVEPATDLDPGRDGVLRLTVSVQTERV